MAALEAKRSGDSQTALKYIKIVKQFDLVINALTNGEVVDLRNMPGPPGSDVPSPPKEDNLTQKSADPSKCNDNLNINILMAKNISSFWYTIFLCNLLCVHFLFKLAQSR